MPTLIVDTDPLPLPLPSFFKDHALRLLPPARYHKLCRRDPDVLCTCRGCHSANAIGPILAGRAVALHKGVCFGASHRRGYKHCWCSGSSCAGTRMLKIGLMRVNVRSLWVVDSRTMGCSPRPGLCKTLQLPCTHSHGCKVSDLSHQPSAHHSPAAVVLL